MGWLDVQNLCQCCLYFNTQMFSTFPTVVLLGLPTQPIQQEGIALARSSLRGQRKKLCGSQSEAAKIRPTEKEEVRLGKKWLEKSKN